MPAMALLGLYPREMKTCPHKNLIWKLTATFFVIAKKLQTMQMSISWWMDKQNVVYLCNRRLFKPCKCLSADEWINKMQCIYVTEDCLVMKRNAALIQAATWTDFENKWKKSITKDHISQNSIPMKCPEQANLERQNIWWLPGRRRMERRRGEIANRYRLSFGGSETVLNWTELNVPKLFISMVV